MWFFIYLNPNEKLPKMKDDMEQVSLEICYRIRSFVRLWRITMHNIVSYLVCTGHTRTHCINIVNISTTSGKRTA